MNFRDEGRTIAVDEFAGNSIRYPAMNPAPDGRFRNIEFGKEMSISGLEDRLLDSVVVGPP
jgi:hypothetical protein